MLRSIVASTVLLAVSAPGASAAEMVLSVDPPASAVSFVLGATLHEVHGALPLTAGEIRFDPETGAASGEIRVNAAGAATGNGGRDKKMHAEVLESARFPFITYRVTRAEGRFASPGHSELRLTGSLSLHGSEHPLSVPARVDITGDRVDATAEFQIPYVAWGLSDPSVFVLRVAKTVDVKVHIAGRLSAGGP